MTSNPGDEKVIQDNIHFKGKTRHREVNGAIEVHAGDGIQSKIDSAPVGGEVVFERGHTFDIDSPLTVSTDGLTIKGLRASVSAEIREALSISANDVTVSGGYIDGGDICRRGIVSSGDDTVIDGVTVENISENESGSAPSGIRLSDGRNAVVENCTVRNVSAPYTLVARGIVTSGSNSGGMLKIRGNTVKDISPVDDADGIVVGGSWTRSVVTGNVLEDCYKRSVKIQPGSPGLSIVSNNQCYYTLTNPIPFCAIAVQQDNVLVSDNEIDYETANISLIQVQGNDVGVSGNTAIVRNPDTGCDGVNAPIDLTGLRVSDNSIIGVQRDAIRFGEGVTDTVADGNVIRGPGRHGVMVGDGTIVPDSVSVAGNAIDGAGGRGIIIYGATNTSVTGNSGTSSSRFIDLFNNADVEIGHNSGYVTTDSGTTTATGDGSTATFTIPHDCDGVVTGVSIEPETEAAAATYWVTNKTASNFDITYSTAPADTASLKWTWNVEVEP